MVKVNAVKEGWRERIAVKKKIVSVIVSFQSSYGVISRQEDVIRPLVMGARKKESYYSRALTDLPIWLCATT